MLTLANIVLGYEENIKTNFEYFNELKRKLCASFPGHCTQSDPLISYSLN